MNRSWVTPDFGERLKAEILARYPGVIAFCLKKGFAPPDVYRWINGVSPTSKALIRLSVALDLLPGILQWGPDLGKAEKDRYVLEIAHSGPPQLTGGAGQSPLPGELEGDEGRGPKRDYVKKPLAPVRRLPRRVERAS